MVLCKHYLIYFVQTKFDFKVFSNLTISRFLREVAFLSQMKIYLRNLKWKILGNYNYNFENYNFETLQCFSTSPINKKVDTYHSKVVFELPHKLPNDLVLKSLENYEIL